MKLKIGDSQTEEFIISQTQVNQFAELTGDKNPLHTNKNYALKTRFKKPIVHGLFSFNFAAMKAKSPDSKYRFMLKPTSVCKGMVS